MSTTTKTKTSHRLRSCLAGAGVVLALAAVPAAVNTVEPTGVAHAYACGGYHGVFISAGGCGGYGYGYGAPMGWAPPPPPPPVYPVGVGCGSYHGPLVTVGGCR